MKEKLIIGSRGSQLALWQAHFVRQRLTALTERPIEIVTIKTTGDRFLDAAVTTLDKGVFVKEIERALLEGRIDMAVHSMKDVPTDIPEGLTMGAICARHDVRDCLLSRDGQTLESLPSGSRVGTSSWRRKAQLRHRRPDLEFVDIRGNVDTRWRKLCEGSYDAIVLAKAGLDRLGWTDRITQVLSTETVLPAVGQGALGVEVRTDDREVLALLSSIDHPPTRVAVMAERALLRALHGGCQVPMGAWGHVEGDVLWLEVCIISLDGERIIRDRLSGSPSEGERLGAHLARKLTAQGADRILEEVNAYRQTQRHAKQGDIHSE
ncbi:MAG: hydroxymethylbilane synthase [Acidobacteria bacterium]|nr:MAG: hydroxymethylbilane synthase [Acidobacteriota bacterium]